MEEIIEPKEKALEIIKFYIKIIPDATPFADILESAKACALVLIDTIIKFGNQKGLREQTMYWKTVRQEVIKINCIMLWKS
jgi:hypothetical protein